MMSPHQRSVLLLYRERRPDARSRRRPHPRVKNDSRASTALSLSHPEVLGHRHPTKGHGTGYERAHDGDRGETNTSARLRGYLCRSLVCVVMIAECIARTTRAASCTLPPSCHLKAVGTGSVWIHRLIVIFRRASRTNTSRGLDGCIIRPPTSDGLLNRMRYIQYPDCHDRNPRTKALMQATD